MLKTTRRLQPIPYLANETPTTTSDMFTFRRPTPEDITRFLQSQASLPFSYPEVGMTAGVIPAHYVIDRNSILLGQGEATFRAARDAVREWAMFRVGWVSLVPLEQNIRPGTVVGIVVHRLGVWSVNACRVNAVIDETSGDAEHRSERFGLVYGTLPGHAESGEERFLIEWNRADDTVRFEILAGSRPAHWLTRWAKPMTRQFQKQFARDAMAALKAATIRQTGHSQ